MDQNAHSLIGLIDGVCQTHGERDCLIFGGRRWSFREVQALSCQVANGLAGAGVQPGDRAAIFSPNDPMAFVATLGIIRAGAIWVPVNPRNSLADNLALLRSFGCDALFFHSSFADAAKRVAAEHPNLKALVALDEDTGGAVCLDIWIQDQPVVMAPIPVQPRDIVMIPMTGGTTGLPKAVALSNRNFAAILRGTLVLETDPNPVNLAAAPMTHVGGRIALTTMYRGGTSVILGAPDPAKILEAIARHKVTDLFLPPTAVYALMDHPDTATADLSTVRRIAYGSAPMSVDKLKQALNLFGPVMVGGFGQTEAPMLIARLTQADHFIDGKIAPDERLRTVGRATPASTLAIMAEDGSLLPPGQVGEIVVKGDFVAEGYFQNPEATAAIRRNGWHLTGDIGHLSADGFLTIVDRKKDMIITGGFNVYSAEVEAVISAIPGVRDCLVVGVPDEKWGEAVKAVVQLDANANLTESQICGLCRDALGPIKAPKSVDFVTDLPRNANGKVVKKIVRNRYWAGAGRAI